MSLICCSILYKGTYFQKKKSPVRKQKGFYSIAFRRNFNLMDIEESVIVTLFIHAKKLILETHHQNINTFTSFRQILEKKKHQNELLCLLITDFPIQMNGWIGTENRRTSLSAQLTKLRSGLILQIKPKKRIRNQSLPVRKGWCLV